MLGHAHGPGADHALCALIDLRRLAQLRLTQAGLLGDLCPGGGVYLCQIVLNAGAVLLNKRQIEQWRLALRQPLAMGFQQCFDHTAHRGHIAAQLRLEVGGTDGRGDRR